KYRYVVPIWSTRTGARLFELHTEANDAAFSDDGQRLAVVFSNMQQALSVWTLSGDAAKVEQTAGPGPHSRQDRVEENGHYVGKSAAELVDKFQPTWGDTQLGLQYGLALTKPQPQRKFRSGERVSLVVFFRNASDQPIKFDTAPDFFGNTPKVHNTKGEPISLENIPLLGHIPHYHEKLEPGEALGPFYLNFGLGENPRPGQQNWHPYFKTPVAGQYKLTHSVSINVAGQKDGEPSKRDDIATGTIEFEIIDAPKVAEVNPVRPQTPRPQPRPDRENPAKKPGEGREQSFRPLLEFRFAAQPADSKLEPRVPADYAKRDYSGNTAIGRMIAKDKGFIWVPVAESKDRISTLPIERTFGGQVREALLADTPEHALPFNFKWSIEDCRVVPDESVGQVERFAIELKLNEAGGAALRTLTKSHLNQPLAILVNDEIIAAPIVRSEIGRDIAITGNFTREQADKLAAALRPHPVAGGPPPQGDEPKTLNGLRTRMTLLSEKAAVGLPLTVKIELQNVGTVERTYESQRANPEYRLEVIGPDGKPAEYINGPSQIQVGSAKVKPGETVTLWAEVDVASMFLLPKPGRYEIKLRGPDKFDAGENDPTRVHPIPTSNTVAVTLAAGTLNEMQTTFVRVRDIAPKGWEISTRGDSIIGISPMFKKGNPQRGVLHLLFLAERKTDEQKLLDVVPYEYLGRSTLGHAYLAASPETKTEWPKCVEQIRELLPLMNQKAVDLRSEELRGQESRAVQNPNIAPLEWGKELNGLRTRVTLLTEKPAVGQPLKVKIELQNIGKVERTYQSQRADPDYLLDVVGPDGKPAEFIKGGSGIPVQTLKIKPDETVVLWEDVDVASMFLLPKPGRYEIKLRGPDRFDVDAAGPERAHPNPASNTLAVTLADGTLNNIQATFVRIRNIAPKDWNISTRGNSISNIQKSITRRGEFLLLFTKERQADDQKLGGTIPYEYLGLTRLGHAYLAVNPQAKTEWPECVEKIREQLPVLDQKPGDLRSGERQGQETLAERKPKIDPNGEIVGLLIDAATGKPVEGATIACGAVINDSLKGGGANAVTDAEGRYRLPVPSPGIYNVWLKKFDKDPGMTAAADDGLLVEAGKVSTSQLLLVKGRKVVGYVVDTGKPLANINVHCNSTAWPQSAKTKDDGTFEFVLPPGRAHLHAIEPVGKSNDNPFGLGRRADAHINVSATEEVAPIMLTLRKHESKFGDPKWLSRSTPGTQIVRHKHAADVTGTVVDVSGKPISGAKVFREDGLIHLSDDKGEFKVSVNKGTQFVMHAFAPGYHVWFGTPTAGDVLKIVMEKKPVAKPIANAGRAAAPIVQSVDVRFVGGPKNEPLPKVKVEFTSGHGSERKSFGTFTTDDAGWLKATLPVGFYYLHLSSEKEWPYLPFEKFWTGNGQGVSRSLNVRVSEPGVEKWLDGKRREAGFEAATAERPARITFTLEPAVELVLRAVDVETGKGLPGTEFYEEVAAGEDWAHPVYGLNLGTKFDYGSKELTGPGNLTDKDGNLRRWVGEQGEELKFGVTAPPPGYELVEPKIEVAVITQLGQARAEKIFKFRRVQAAATIISVPVVDNTEVSANAVFVQLDPPKVDGDFSKVNDPDVLLDQLAKG
ncbi:MAG: hypothetical protein IAG10_24325, partial [Planctomycetaceae bacterium]|nr:hypothetical protein [Planctomycetaceae bacterium]